jgi:hypothetical protein
MEEDINTKLVAIMSKKTSWAYYLWIEILADLNSIGSSAYKEKLAFIFIFSDIEKYSYELESLSVSPGYLNELATLLCSLFNTLKKHSEIKKIFCPQLAFYMRNLSILMEKLAWSAQLCKKTDSLLIELLEIAPFNKNIAKAVPNAYLTELLNDIYYFESWDFYAYANKIKNKKCTATKENAISFSNDSSNKFFSALPTKETILSSEAELKPSDLINRKG